MDATALHVLVVEDDRRTAGSLRRGLEGAGIACTLAADGETGLREALAGSFDVIVLDWMLPGRDGLSVLASLKEHGGAVPVLLVTARDAIDDRVRGLESGADDYLVKPFAFAELLARVRALARRAARDAGPPPSLGDLRLDPRRRRATKGPRTLDLTPREYDLLAFLFEHRGQTVTRRMLAREVWGEPRRATSLDNVIDVHVGNLRRKLEEGGSPRLVHTVRGVGFVLDEARDGKEGA